MVKRIVPIKSLLKWIKSLFLKYSFYYFKISGAAPIAFHVKLSQNMNVKQCTFTHSTSGIMYNLLFICVIILWNSTAQYFSSNSAYVNDPTIFVFVDLFQIITSIFALVMFIIKNNQQSELFNKMSQMKDITRRHFSNSNFGLPIKHILLIIGGNVLWLTHVIVISFIYCRNTAFYYNGIKLVGFVQNGIIFEYCVLLLLLKSMFKSMNDHTFELSERTCINSELLYSNEVANGKILAMRDFHLKLSDLCQDISEFYSLNTLMIIAHQFLAVTAGTYYVVRPLFVERLSMNVFYLFDEFFWIFPHFYNLIFLTNLATSIVDEVNINQFIFKRKFFLTQL